METWRKTYRPELAKLQESSNDSGTSGRRNPSPRPQSYASICQWSSLQRHTPVRRRRRQPASPTSWMSSIDGASDPS
ncbi:Hypothetical predicted protein [Xyrichtys novacula]|uniref:Uncharacterized protein n=1 Tax=Xyrichtys novacula TaxID=13765 RepID=A0AAV1G5T9_XYRNO|nr:Hypothetical predicted protein [Xyrichtys novacula]